MKKVILGTGISGLVLAECFKQNGVPDKDVALIGKSNLGQQKYNFNLGPRILHSTKKTLEFLRNIGINEEPKVFNVGYVKDGKTLESISLEDKEFYAKKNKKRLERSTLSEGKTSILGWDLKEINLAEVLLERHKSKITNCSLSKVEITEITKEADEVYCTFPLSEVSDVFANSLDYVSYVLTDKEFRFEDKSYVYDLGNNKIKRISNFKGVCVYEFVDSVTAREAERIINKMSKTKVKVLDIVQLKTTIIEGEKIDWYNGMRMVGRFATNNHSERIDTIIEKYLGV